MNKLSQRITAGLQHQRQQGRWRQQVARTSGHGRLLSHSNGTTLINFASNDYLGLANDAIVRQAFVKAADQYGVGSGGSALITGYHQLHQHLCEQLADITGMQRVMLFGSGFAANQGVITALMKSGDLLIQDKLNHASLIDAGLHCRADSVRYRHNDLTSAEQQLQRQAEAKLLVTESVFSMDGDQAPLNELAQRSQRHEAMFMVDDAHGLGVIGDQGLGATSIEPNIDVYMATFGKALGVGGAMIAGDKDIIEYLTQFCRHYVYTTAMPPAMAAAASAALNRLTNEPELVATLKHRIGLFKKLAQQANLPLLPSNTAIQPVLLPGNDTVVSTAEYMRQRGFAVGAIRAPTVKAGQERLRLTISASHTERDIENCVATLNEEMGRMQEHIE
ncbi:8-amino-7-oxononanoate synthase [Neiella marina]|uniref:8-amino-7-oxononanoate synthase n=1 Tax=Neiella marina TaxID=508461 RepID=A0A8J2XP27_9GAMM|nr:8-amino-7-oxononanoate synthase [Neiella marina]GGA77823.1 8-amino-7-oxononanoate synthase [Neiella marina]